jgi:hypothetical protein
VKNDKAEKVLVILGLDSHLKPHAARFSPAEEAAVRKAATATGFGVGAAKTEEAIALASKLVPGKLFATGKGLVPLTTAETYEKLLRVLELEAAPAADTIPPSTEKPATAHPSDPRAAITVGSVVLVQDKEPPPNRAWWECVVAGVGRNPNDLLVRWKAFPALKPFPAKRTAVGLLPSKP